MATAPPFAGSIIIMQENDDGIHMSLFHWTDLAQASTVPPRGTIVGWLLGGNMPPSLGSVGVILPDFVRNRMPTTRAGATALISALLDAKYPKTPA